MAHTPDHARRLLRELEPQLPAAAPRILERVGYRDPGFFDRLVNYVEDLIFREPQAGLEVAKVTPRLARIILAEARPKERRDHLTRRARALGLVGTAYRAVGQLAEAEKRYREALTICRQERLPPLCKAELFLRWATLRNRQKRFSDAHRFITEAMSIFELEEADAWISTALATRGVSYFLAGRFPDAVALLSEVLGHRKLTPRLGLSVTGNLGYAVLGLEDPQRLDEALRYLREARRLLGPRQSIQKSRLYWIEGMACIRRGRTDDGERRYRKALAGFLKFGAIYEHALVALDLSALLRFAGRWPELENLAADSFARFREQSADTEALAALRLWLDAVGERKLSEELLHDVKSRLEDRARRNP